MSRRLQDLQRHGAGCTGAGWSRAWGLGAVPRLLSWRRFPQCLRPGHLVTLDWQLPRRGRHLFTWSLPGAFWDVDRWLWNHIFPLGRWAPSWPPGLSLLCAPPCSALASLTAPLHPAQHGALPVWTPEVVGPSGLLPGGAPSDLPLQPLCRNCRVWPPAPCGTLTVCGEVQAFCLPLTWPRAQRLPFHPPSWLPSSCSQGRVSGYQTNPCEPQVWWASGPP